MARIRTVKPDFWTDDTITACSVAARLLFIGSWNFADDAGNLDRSAKQIKARVFPVDNIDCEPLIQELIAHGLIVEYEAEGRKFLHIRGFAKHQQINRPSKPSCPPYQDSMRTHALLTEDSLSPPGALMTEGRKEGRKGREGENSPDGHLPDPVKEFFDLGIAILTAAGHSERSARGLLGKLRKAKTDPEAAALLVAAKATSDPAAYLARAMLPRQREFVE